MKWWGWHAFRRGLATNLHRLGVPDKTIQAILRHANISTTLNNYAGQGGGGIRTHSTWYPLATY